MSKSNPSPSQQQMVYPLEALRFIDGANLVIVIQRIVSVSSLFKNCSQSGNWMHKLDVQSTLLIDLDAFLTSCFTIYPHQSFIVVRHVFTAAENIFSSDLCKQYSYRNTYFSWIRNVQWSHWMLGLCAPQNYHNDLNYYFILWACTTPLAHIICIIEDLMWLVKVSTV